LVFFCGSKTNVFKSQQHFFPLFFFCPNRSGDGRLMRHRVRWSTVLLPQNRWQRVHVLHDGRGGGRGCSRCR
jgi:hypothetical protein